MTVIDHLGHRPFAPSHRFGDDSDELIWNIDHRDLDRLVEDTVDLLGNDLRAGDLHLIPLAPHLLDEVCQLQLAASGDPEAVGRVGLFDPDRDVAEQLLVEPLPQLPGGDMLAVLASEGRGVDPEDHRDGRLIDDDARQGARIRRRRDRVPDVDPFDPGNGDDIPGRCRLDRDLLQSLEGVELGDLRAAERSIVLADTHLIPDGYLPIEDSSDGEPPDIFTVIEIGHQHLEGRRVISRGGRDGLEDLLEERPQVGAFVGQLVLGDTIPRDGVENRKIDLLVIGVEVDEEVVDLVDDLFRARVLAIDLVDDDHHRQLLLQGF